MKQRPLSQSVFEASCRVIPGGVNSPVRAFPGLSLTPIMATKGEGDTVWDIDGHSYIDYCGSWGALILGHAPLAVIQQAIEQIQKGSTFGMATPYEREIAEKVGYFFPSMEKMRFVSSGTEAVMSAIRLSRGYTGKNTIIKFDGNYHGHSDSLLVRAGSGAVQLNAEASSAGVPLELASQTLSLPYNDIEFCRQILREREDIAAVLIEPIAGNMGVVPAKPAFLQMLREETKERGIVLIFDEVITGFRVCLRGAQGLYGIRPDLTCLGKIIGGGFPAAAFGGKKEIMDHLAPLGKVYQAGTLSGNPVAMRAGLATLQEIEKEGFYEALQQKTDLLLNPIQEFIASSSLPICLNRVGSMFTLFFGKKEVDFKEVLDEEMYKQFFCYLFERGIYFPPAAYEAAFVSSAHTEEHLLYTRGVILEFLVNEALA